MEKKMTEENKNLCQYISAFQHPQKYNMTNFHKHTIYLLHQTIAGPLYKRTAMMDDCILRWDGGEKKSLSEIEFVDNGQSIHA